MQKGRACGASWLCLAIASLSSAALGQAGSAPVAELISGAPSDWRFERLEFPLSFASELDYEGFEELRFAPGMFQPGSPSYFTYAFAIRLEEDLTVDADFLEEFLYLYYRGLCENVGESRDLDLDLDQIEVRVLPGHGVCQVELHIFDAFVTGKPLRLYGEVHADTSVPGRTDLLGLVSPQDRNAALWELLSRISQAFAEDHSLPVFLNHTFVVPDAQTYAALAESEFLRTEFAVSEERTTVRPDRSYTGLYFYGQETYFEFLKPGSTERFQEGSSGLALGLELPGATGRLAERLRAQQVPSFAGEIGREFQGATVPWFEILGVQVAHAESRLSTFALAYEPEFLQRFHPQERAVDSIRRRSILRRYDQALNQQELRTRALFQDIEEVHLALDEREQAHWRKLCTALGFTAEQDAERLICQAPQHRYVVEPSKAPGGITALVLRLSRPLPSGPTEMQFGRTRLTLSEQQATWVFRVTEAEQD